MSTTSTKVRFLHSSDWQLGMTRAFFPAEAAARFGQARIDAIIALGVQAEALDAQFLVVAGDVFESNQLSRQVLVRTLDALAAVPVPVFLLPGNHDPLDASSLFATPEFRKAPSHIQVLQDMAPLPVPGLTGVEVVGAPWRTKHPNRDLCAELIQALEPDSSKVRVLVAHGQLDTLSPDPNKPDLINLARVEDALTQGLFQYLALGDRHSVYNGSHSGRVWYSGAPVATAFTEDRPNHALLVELDGHSSCTVEPVPIGNWHFVAEHRIVNSAADVDAFAGWLNQLPHKHTSAVKVSFEGSVNLAIAAQLDELMHGQQDLFGSLRKRERLTQLAVVPDALDEDSLPLSGYAQATWDQLLEQARSGDEVAQDALRLFYRLARQAS